MNKSRLELVPWDVCVITPVASEQRIVAAKMWWIGEIARLPCTVPEDCLHGVGRVLGWSTLKYAEGDWARERLQASRHFGAIMRHAYSRGLDDESQLPHEWHAMCRYMMLSALLARGVLIDDRPERQVAADEVRVPAGSYGSPGGDS